MTTVNEDIDTLASEPSSFSLESGFEVEIQRLKTRQLMSLLRILTRGAGPVLAEMNFSEDMNQQEFTGQLIGAVLMSIPEAQDETIDFLRSMVSPAKLTPGKSKPEKEVNQGLVETLNEELDNPEITDMLAIVEKIVRAEAPHIQALGKQLAVLFTLQTKSDTAKQGGSRKKS